MREKIIFFRLGPVVIDYDPPCLEFNLFEFGTDNFPVQIFGENGTGKTSLALLIAGAIPNAIDAKTKVESSLKTNLGNYNLVEAQSLFRSVPQRFSHALLGYRIYEEIKISSGQDEKWCNYVTNEMCLSELFSRQIFEISDGEKRRLLISLALISDSPLILFDEWTTNLDFYWRNKILYLLQEYQNRGGSCIFFSSHIDFTPYRTLFNLSDQHHRSEDYIFNDTQLTDLLSKDLSITEKNFFENYGNSIDINIKYRLDSNKKVRISSLPGTILEIVGPNGSGKTTLIRNIWRLSHSHISHLFFRKLTLPKVYLTSSDPIYQVLGPTVEDELLKVIKTRQLIDELFSVLRINPKTDVLSLSFGQRKILSILVGVLSSYPVLAIDEPFSGLDDYNYNVVKQAIIMASKFGKLVIVTSTDQSFGDVMNYDKIEL